MDTRRDIAAEAIWAGELTEDELERTRRGLVEKSFGKGAYICHRGDRLSYWTGVLMRSASLGSATPDG